MRRLVRREAGGFVAEQNGDWLRGRRNRRLRGAARIG